MRPDGYITSALRGLASVKASVNGPTRPISIKTITIHCPLTDKPGVIPRDRPVVDAADTTSNARSRKLPCSVSISKKVPVITQNKAMMVIAKARKVMFASMLRPNSIG